MLYESEVATTELSRLFRTDELKDRRLIPSQKIDWYLLLMINDGEKGNMTVGRSDLTEGWYPSVDLQPYGGGKAGISRKHLDIDCGRRTFSVQRGNTNRTFLNLAPVASEQEHPLSDGDFLVIGHVLLHVRFLPYSEVGDKFKVAQYSEKSVEIISRLVIDEGTKLKRALYVESQMYRAKRNLRVADPDEPTRVLFIGSRSKEID